MRRAWIRPLLALIAVAALLAVPAAVTAQPAQADKQPTATGRGGAAATVDVLATKAAVEALRDGANAIDAAVVAAAVLGVTEPFSSGIGGGGFMVIRTSDGKITTIDHRERAPAAMRPDSSIKSVASACIRSANDGNRAACWARKARKSHCGMNAMKGQRTGRWLKSATVSWTSPTQPRSCRTS